MRKILILLFSLVLILIPHSIFAHPGGLDDNGGHHCWTNCEKYGLENGEYHYHNDDGTIRRLGEISIYINGIKQTYDQQPIIENQRTLVPLRGIFESLGATVEWNQQEKLIKATLNNTVVELKLGSTTAKINGQNVTIDVPAKTLNGRTLVPLRFVSESLGATVAYDNATMRIDIYTDIATYPTFHATVIGHIDGDTIKLNIDGKIETTRLILVDTPETKHPQIGEQPFGREASEFTKKLLPIGKSVQVELDVSERDRYGRLLAYIYVDGKMLNELLLEKGLARLAVFPPNTRYLDKFKEIEQKAKEQKIGIWSIETY